MRGRLGLLEGIASGAVVLAGSLLMGGCPNSTKGTDPNSSSGGNDGPTNKNVVVPSEGAGKFLGADRNVFYFADGGPKVQSGSFLASGEGEGFMVKVNGDPQEINGRLSVPVESVPYAEAVENGTFQFKGEAGKERGRSLNVQVFNWNHEFLNETIKGPGSSEIVVDGSLGLSANLKLDATIQSCRLELLENTLEGKLSADSFAEIKAKGGFDVGGEIPLLTTRVYYPFTLGWAPGVLIVDGKMVLEGSAEASGEINAAFGVRGDAEIEFGFKYERGNGVSFVGNHSYSFEPLVGHYCYDGKAEGSAKVRIELTCSVNGVAHLSSALIPYVEAKGTAEGCYDSTKTYSWEIDAGATLGAKASVGAFDWTKTLFEKDDLFDGKFMYSIASGSNDKLWHGPIASGIPNGNSGGGSVSGDNGNGGNDNGGSNSGGNNGGGGDSNSDDTKDHARLLTFSPNRVATISDYLGGNDGNDWYKFVVADPRSEVWLSSSKTGDLQAILDIQGPIGPEWHLGLGNGGRLDDSSNTHGEAAGTYYINVDRVWGQETTSGNYTLNIEIR